jgi:hypothetical protein
VEEVMSDVVAIPVTFQFKATDLSDLLATVVEGNLLTMAWARFDSGVDYDLGPYGITYDTLEAAGAMGIKQGPGYTYLPLLEGCAVTIHEFDEATGEDVATYRLDLDAVKRGLERMSVMAPKHFANFTSGDYDIETADVFLQLALLGEIRYG